MNMFTKSKYRFNAQRMETFLDHFGALGGILFEHGAGGLGVVDGHAGEEQKSDGGDDHEGGVAGGRKS